MSCGEWGRNVAIDGANKGAETDLLCLSLLVSDKRLDALKLPEIESSVTEVLRISVAITCTRTMSFPLTLLPS